MRLASSSESGMRARNEDDLRCGVTDGTAYAVLSDGAGGHRDGAMASDMVVRCVTVRLQSARELLPQQLHEVVSEANELLVEHQSCIDEHDRMHATLVALWVDLRRGLALWSHVGDSRLYVLRDGRILHTTRDDTVVNQLLEAGLISTEVAAEHPLKHHLSLAMGIANDFAAHTLEKPFPLRPGDALLLCSDGWWGSIDAEDIEESYAAAAQPQAWLDEMAARIRAAQRSQQDNYSAVALSVESYGGPTSNFVAAS